MRYKSHSKVLREQLKNTKLAKEYKSLGLEYELVKALIEARISKHYTQADIAKKVGMQQSAIARIESGAISPSIQTYVKIANAIGRKIVLN